MTPEQKKKYLESPFHCPFCGSENIHADRFECSDGGAYQPVLCSSCHKKWNDIYTLTDVEEVV